MPLGRSLRTASGRAILSLDAGTNFVEKGGGGMSRVQNPFQAIMGGYFMALWGPASISEWPGCQKKLCFVATDRALLADVLRELADRPDCVFVKYSTYQKDGMYLGRCFLTNEYEVGVLWAKYKEHPRLFCSVQDDDFTARLRGEW
jgi:hypothetical protein